MATNSLTFLGRIRSAWVEAQCAIVAQFEELQAQLAPSLTKVDATATTVAALGVSVVPPYVASNFTGSGAMTWTVPTATVLNLSYTRVGAQLALSWYLIGTTVAGVTNTYLQIALPVGLTVARTMGGSCWASDNGVLVSALATAIAGDRMIKISRTDFAMWTVGGGATTSTVGTFTCEVR